MVATNPPSTPDFLPGGTRAISTLDGEPGCVLNYYGTDTRGEWYEVETRDAIELWTRAEMLTLDEINEMHRAEEE